MDTITFRVPTIAVSQQLDATAYQSTAIDVWVSARVEASIFDVPGTSIAIEYREFGTLPWVRFTTMAPVVSSSVTITGLAASTRYEVRAVLLNAANNDHPSEVAPMFTKIAPPSATIATAGAGTPVTNITVTPPGALAGFDTEIRNAGGAFDALYSNVSTAPTVYQSTAGSCGVEDRYFVRARSTSWPDGYQYSAPVELSVVNPCVIAP